MKFTTNYSDKIDVLKKEIETAEAVLIGAGSGLSTAAGFTYSGERFEKYFSDFKRAFRIGDMYSGGFYPFPDLETYWAWWSRHIYINRYQNKENELYRNLFNIVNGKNYFVITTNVDHQFQLAGFDKKRLFYTQGDYGLFQCMTPCRQETFDNEEMVENMLISQGFATRTSETLEINNPERWKMRIDSSLVPHCPHCGKPLNVNLRCDDSFVQDEGWYRAKDRYDDFVRRNENSHILYLELGVGMNTPVWIKYPFIKRTYANPDAVYACLNRGEASAPREIENRSICINGDIGDVLNKIKQ